MTSLMRGDRRAPLVEELRTQGGLGGGNEVEGRHAEMAGAMLQVPNIPDISVPGGGDKDNKEVRTWGKIPEFTARLNHMELMEACDMATLCAGGGVSVSAGTLKNRGASVRAVAIIEHFD